MTEKIKGWFCSRCKWFHYNKPADKCCSVCNDTLEEGFIAKSLLHNIKEAKK